MGIGRVERECFPPVRRDSDPGDAGLRVGNPRPPQVRAGSPPLSGSGRPLVSGRNHTAMSPIRSTKLKVQQASRNASNFSAGLVAPAATPKAVQERLHAEVQKALQTKEVRERMSAVGGDVIPGSADTFASLIRSEHKRYEKLVREANIKPD